jgi:hypothetical protein
MTIFFLIAIFLFLFVFLDIACVSERLSMMLQVEYALMLLHYSVILRTGTYGPERVRVEVVSCASAA